MKSQVTKQVKTPKCIMILKHQRCECRKKPENKLLTRGPSMNIIEVSMLMTAHILLYSKIKRRKLEVLVNSEGDI